MKYLIIIVIFLSKNFEKFLNLEIPDINQHGKMNDSIKHIWNSPVLKHKINSIRFSQSIKETGMKGNQSKIYLSADKIDKFSLSTSIPIIDLKQEGMISKYESNLASEDWINQDIFFDENDLFMKQINSETDINLRIFTIAGSGEKPERKFQDQIPPHHIQVKDIQLSIEFIYEKDKFEESSCPKGTGMCGNFGDQTCSCDCGRDCSICGLCGTGAFYALTKQEGQTNEEKVEKISISNFDQSNDNKWKLIFSGQPINFKVRRIELRQSIKNKSKYNIKSKSRFELVSLNKHLINEPKFDESEDLNLEEMDCKWKSDQATGEWSRFELVSLNKHLINEPKFDESEDLNLEEMDCKWKSDQATGEWESINVIIDSDDNYDFINSLTNNSIIQLWSVTGKNEHIQMKDIELQFEYECSNPSIFKKFNESPGFRSIEKWMCDKKLNNAQNPNQSNQ